MLNYYQEFTLLPQEEIPLHFLWSKVFQQFHLGLVAMQDDTGRIPIGVSFPEYVNGKTLGKIVRILARDEATLSQFNASHWLARLSDYVHCTSIRPVPAKITGYAIYQREQPKTNKERLARRYAKRHGVDMQTALFGEIGLTVTPPPNKDYKTQFRYCELPKKSVPTPFIRLKSLSGGQTFCLWIKKTLVSAPSAAAFSSYGLSAVATVPEF